MTYFYGPLISHWPSVAGIKDGKIWHDQEQNTSISEGWFVGKKEYGQECFKGEVDMENCLIYCDAGGKVTLTLLDLLMIHDQEVYLGFNLGIPMSKNVPTWERVGGRGGGFRR